MPQIWRGEDGVQSDAENIIYHFRNDARQQGTRDLQARIRIYLNKRQLEVLIEHKVIAKELKRVSQPARVYLPIHCSVRICHQLPYLRHEISEHIYVSIVRISVGAGWVTDEFQVLLEVMQTHLISVLVLSIVLGVLLHCVVSQMNVLIVQVLDVKFLTACPDVAVFVEIPFQVSIYGSHKAIAPKVELAVVD